MGGNLGDLGNEWVSFDSELLVGDLFIYENIY